MEIVERAAFRVTRDADFEVSDEADDLLEAVELELRRRRFGDVVRLEVVGSMSRRCSSGSRGARARGDDQVYPIHGLLDLADVMQIAALDRPDLKDEPWVPVTQAAARAAHDGDELFAEIRRGDILVHHPYESFATSFEAFLRAAVARPDGDRRSRRRCTARATSRRSCPALDRGGRGRASRASASSS